MSQQSGSISSFFSTIRQIVGEGTEIYRQIEPIWNRTQNNSPSTPLSLYQPTFQGNVPSTTGAPAQTDNVSKYVPYALIGMAALIVLYAMK